MVSWLRKKKLRLGRGPIFHRGAPRCHWGATLVTRVQVRSPGCTGVTMKPVGVHPSQPEMQNLAGVEISALKSDWGALQAHEKFHRGGHKLSTFHWGLGSITSGLHYFPKISLGCTPEHPGAPRCTPVHPGAPRCTPAGAVMKGVTCSPPC